MKQKILIVDDSKTYLTFASQALEQAGYKVVVAEDIWVSRVVKAENPDLILMDVSLGASKGTCAVTAIRKWQFTQGIRIFLHSSEVAEKLQILTRECGADGYIVKDGNAAQLAQKVASALQMKRSGVCV